MDLLFGLIQGILGIGWSILSFIFTLIIVIVICAIALFKRRNVALWGIAGLFFPWLILIIPFVPVKRPKLRADLRNHEAFRGKNPMVASIMALAAIVAKTDGAISKEEIGVVKDFISKHFGIVGDELLSYGDAFNYGKNHPEEYVEFARLVGSYYGTRDVVSAIAYLLVSVAVQDGSISDKEDLKLRQILGEMGFSEYEYRSLKNAFTHEYSSYDYFGGYGNNYGNGSYSQGTQGGAMSQATLIKKYSEVLGVSEDASMSEIKKAYRKLVKEYHPDKLASESMPEDYVEYANKKIIEINEAYEYLKGIKEA